MTGAIKALTRSDAVREIAETMATRDHYLAAGYASPALGDALDQIPDWLAYLDNASDIVMTIRAADSYGQLVRVAGALIPTCAVVAIPKTTPPQVLQDALRIDQIARDESQDLILLSNSDQYHWPALFVDAIAINDPATAAQIYASDVRTLS